jgi:hypothetical protein
VWVIFLFSAALMIITLVHFLLGIVAERAVCEPLQEPEDNQLLALVDKVIRLEKFLESEEEISVSSIIRFVKKFTLEEATKAHRGSRGVALLFLQPRH